MKKQIDNTSKESFFDFYEKKERQKKPIKISIILLLLTLALIAGRGFYKHCYEITIPDLTYKTEQEVDEWAKKNNYNKITYLQDYKFDISDGLIYEQSEIGNHIITTPLTLHISRGPNPDERIILPDFSGKTEKEITTYFTKARITNYSFAYVTSDRIPSGYYIGDTRTPNYTRSSKITVKISTGGDRSMYEFKMPSFLGLTKNEVERWADEFGINVTYKNMYSAYDAGIVCFQSVITNNKVKTGDTVEIGITIGHYIPTFMDFKGMKESVFESWCINNDTTYNANYYYSLQDEGVIIDTWPSAYTECGTDWPFSINVSLGKVKIPDLKTEKEANKWLGDTNKKILNESDKISITYKYEASKLDVGSIIESKTRPDQYVDFGSKLIMTISKNE